MEKAYSVPTATCLPAAGDELLPGAGETLFPAAGVVPDPELSGVEAAAGWVPAVVPSPPLEGSDLQESKGMAVSNADI